MRTYQIFKRVLLQRRSDRRSLALVFLAPIFIMTLLFWLMHVPASVTYRVGLAPSDSSALTTTVKNESKFDIISVKNESQKTMNNKHLDAIVKFDGKKLIVTYANQSAASTQVIKSLLTEHLQMTQAKNAQAQLKDSVQTNMKASLEKAQTGLITAIQQEIKATASQNPQAAIIAGQAVQAAVTKVKTESNQAGSSGFSLQLPQASTISMDSHYLYGSSNINSFDDLAPVFIGAFVFMLVFLISGISIVGERSNGTLERMLATPVKRSEIVMGYALSYGVLALLQTAVIILWSRYVLNVHITGSLLWVFVINFLLALGAVLFGLLISALAKNEFQFIQFIPIIIAPLFLFSDLINISTMAQPLQWIAHINPVYYAINALQLVMKRGLGYAAIWPNLLVLLGIVVLLYLVNDLALKTLRRT